MQYYYTTQGASEYHVSLKLFGLGTRCNNFNEFNMTMDSNVASRQGAQQESFPQSF